MKNHPFHSNPAAIFFTIVVALVCMVASRPMSALADENAVAPPELPGVWRELESGGWHTDAKNCPGASGGKRVSWFDQVGRAVYVDFTLEKPMPSAIAYLRYSGGGDTPIDLSLASLTPEGEVGEAKPLGQMTLKATGNFEAYAWAKLLVGDLPVGKYRLIYALSEPGGADLDVTGIAPDEHKGLWNPPDQVIDGKLVGAGTVAVALLSVETVARANRPTVVMHKITGGSRSKAGAKAWIGKGHFSIFPRSMRNVPSPSPPNPLRPVRQGGNVYTWANEPHPLPSLSSAWAARRPRSTPASKAADNAGSSYPSGIVETPTTNARRFTDERADSSNS